MKATKSPWVIDIGGKEAIPYLVRIKSKRLSDGTIVPENVKISVYPMDEIILEELSDVRHRDVFMDDFGLAIARYGILMYVDEPDTYDDTVIANIALREWRNFI